MANGLTAASALPVGRGYFQAMVGLSRALPFAHAELGWHPLDPLAVFGYAHVERDATHAGLGARLSW